MRFDRSYPATFPGQAGATRYAMCASDRRFEGSQGCLQVYDWKGERKMFKSKWRLIVLVVLLAMGGVMLCSCRSMTALMGAAPAEGEMDIDVQSFGETPDGRPVRLYTLTNARGMEARIMEQEAWEALPTTPDVQAIYGNIEEIYYHVSVRWNEEKGA